MNLIKPFRSKKELVEYTIFASLFWAFLVITGIVSALPMALVGSVHIIAMVLICPIETNQKAMKAAQDLQLISKNSNENQKAIQQADP